MDCPSEENLIRMKLNDIADIIELEFDIPDRKLTVYHKGSLAAIELAVYDLNLGGKKISTQIIHRKFDSNETDVKENVLKQNRLLWTVLLINFVFFVIEITAGFLSKSMGLAADSLDMLADSFVYGISLLAIGKSLTQKKTVASLAGYVQILLALLGFFEAVRRFIVPQQLPEFSAMVYISIMALIANGYCLYLLQKSNSKEAHMQASMIFTSNDVIINLGVIVAGVLVFYLQSNLPDLIIACIVFAIVMQGALRILKLGK